MHLEELTALQVSDAADSTCKVTAIAIAAK